MPGAEGVPDGVASTLLDRGVLGVCVLVLGALAWWLIRREAARADAAQRQVNDLNLRIRDDLLPAVLRAQEAHTAVTQLLVRVGELLPDVASALRDYDRDRDRGRR
jgi:hypothetical protein